MMNRIAILALMAVSLLQSLTASASKFLGAGIIDKDYIVLHFRDGEVTFRDNGTGPSAYCGHDFAAGDDTLKIFGSKLDDWQNIGVVFMTGRDFRQMVVTLVC